MSITVYSKPRCVQCDATKRALTKRGISFDEVSIADDPQALDQLKDMGFRQAPVVLAGDDSWSGFRPDKIKALETELARLSA